MGKDAKLIPYLTFAGNCEEALNFYKDILGGNLTIASRWDNPAMNAPEDYKNKILHARLDVNDNMVIYASDGGPGMPLKMNSGDVSLSVVYSDDVEDAKKVFGGLSAGGNVYMPFAKQFWGDWYGGFADKYGISWNINFMEQR